MSYFNHRPSSSIHQVPERRWCCPAHCEEHDRLSIEYRAIDGKVAALRNKAVRSNGIRNLFTIQEVSAALDGINGVIDAIDGGITTAKTFHDKFCQEHVTKDVHITTINELKAQRVHTLQVMFELYKKLQSLDSADDRSIVTQPPQYTPVDKTVLRSHGCSTQPSSSRTPLMDQGRSLFKL
ncbi:hypothetical protein QCA50_014470 [Cerrena zonata]|uniref:Uncharacterized protein n=1 Tax=Cerrena zonata TaxID=2478898 RepID=A0AAW0FQ87_9APHY